MGCRCAERGEAINRAVHALREGNSQVIANEVKFVAVSAVQDVASTFRDQMASARVRLTMRRR